MIDKDKVWLGTAVYRAEIENGKIVYSTFVVETLTAKGAWVQDGLHRIWKPFSTRFISMSKGDALFELQLSETIKHRSALKRLTEAEQRVKLVGGELAEPEVSDGDFLFI